MFILNFLNHNMHRNQDSITIHSKCQRDYKLVFTRPIKCLLYTLIVSLWFYNILIYCVLVHILVSFSMSLMDYTCWLSNLFVGFPSPASIQACFPIDLRKASFSDQLVSLSIIISLFNIIFELFSPCHL